VLPGEGTPVPEGTKLVRVARDRVEVEVEILVGPRGREVLPADVLADDGTGREVVHLDLQDQVVVRRDVVQQQPERGRPRSGLNVRQVIAVVQEAGRAPRGHAPPADVPTSDLVAVDLFGLVHLYGVLGCDRHVVLTDVG